MKIQSIVYIVEKKQKNEARVAGWKCSTLRQKRNKESAKYVIENIFQILSISAHTQIVFP